MKDSFYAIFNKEGYVDSKKTDRFQLPAGHHAVRIDLEIPDEVFTPISHPVVKVLVPAEAVIREFTATANTDGEA